MNGSSILVTPRIHVDHVPLVLNEQRRAAMAVSEYFAACQSWTARACGLLAELVEEMEKTWRLITPPPERSPARPGRREDAERPDSSREGDPPAIVLARSFGRAHRRLAAALLRVQQASDHLESREGRPVSAADTEEQFARLLLATSALLMHLHQNVTLEPTSR